MNDSPFLEFGLPLATNSMVYSNKMYFILDEVKELLEYNRKITDIVGVQTDFKSVDPSITKLFPTCDCEIVNSSRGHLHG